MCNDPLYSSYFANYSSLEQQLKEYRQTSKTDYSNNYQVQCFSFNQAYTWYTVYDYGKSTWNLHNTISEWFQPIMLWFSATASTEKCLQVIDEFYTSTVLLFVLYNDFFMNLNHIAHVLSVSRYEYEECLYESCCISLQLRRVLPTVAVWDHTQRCLKSRVWVYNVFVYSITSTLHGIALFRTATRRSLAPNLYLHDFLYLL